MRTHKESEAGLSSARFDRRRSEILDVASDHINAFGVRGMTMTEVARQLRLDTSSITYYFRRKDDLAFACLERTLVWLRDQANRAIERGSPGAAVRSFLHACVMVHRRQQSVGMPHLALLSDMHSMEPERRAPLIAVYVDIVGAMRSALRSEDRNRSLVAVLGLMSVVHWLSAWVPAYGDAEYERIVERLFDLLQSGFRFQDQGPRHAPPPREPGATSARVRFLHAATNLINRDGYRGASVEKIAAELGVSIGSFYHHLENKDELVLACFERSYALIVEAQGIGERSDGRKAGQLLQMATSLFRFQIEAESPLLRSSAYQALPPDLRDEMLRRAAQITNHISGVVADGIAEGSLYPVNPPIAAHFFMSLVNAAAETRNWSTDIGPAEGVKLFSDVLREGIFG